MAKAGEEYELLVKEVYEILNSVDGLDDVKLQHNIKLQGKSRERQIDIFWEFKRAGIPFRVVVECKDYHSPVKAEKIEAFQTALVDLNNPMGIFVTKHGFQEGAVKIAKNYGIQLMVIHGPEDEDWDGYIKEVHLDLTLKLINNPRVKIVINKAWADENGINGLSDEGFAYSEKYLVEGENRISMTEIINQIPRDEEGRGLRRVYQYDDAYIEVGERRYKIRELVITYDIEYAHDEIVIDARKLIKAFVKNVIDNDVKVVDIQGGVRHQGHTADEPGQGKPFPEEMLLK